ncbi:hypothetical protein [Acidocella aminolytica]|nr:hypothetical protein [Acidocella aminolytica]
MSKTVDSPTIPTPRRRNLLAMAPLAAMAATMPDRPRKRHYACLV